MLSGRISGRSRVWYIARRARARATESRANRKYVSTFFREPRYRPAHSLSLSLSVDRICVSARVYMCGRVCVCMCMRECVRVCVRACALRRGPWVLDVVRVAEISNAGHVDAKTPPWFNSHQPSSFGPSFPSRAHVRPLPFNVFPRRGPFNLRGTSPGSSRVSPWREDIPERVNPCAATYRDCLHPSPRPHSSSVPFALPAFPLQRKFSFYGPSRGCNFYFRSRSNAFRRRSWARAAK